jgi:two-component system, response regulator YesN
LAKVNINYGGTRMLKVFLVEDEIVVREGIKNTINWNENGFIFCGEASDGELAYPMIQKLKPDIVITDIRMPFMDGLELSRLLKKDLPQIRIIILSGYGEFEYAKEAINIGITEYLLKPISSAELMKSLVVVRDNILKEQEEKANLEKFKREMKEFEIDEKRRLFNEIVSNSHPLTYILEKGKELNLELSAIYYNIMLFRINKMNLMHEIRTNVQLQLDNLFEDSANVIRFDYSIEGIALLLKGSSQDEITDIQNKYINKIKRLLESFSNVSYFGGIGVPVNRLGELPKSFHEASRAFAYRYIWDCNEILDYNVIAKNPITVTEDIKLEKLNTTQLDKNKVENFLKSGEKEDINYFIEEYLKSCCYDGRNSILFRQYILMDMYFVVSSFMEELGYSAGMIEEPFKDYIQMNVQISTFENSKKYIEKIFHQAIALRDEITTKHYNAIISKAKEYIKENYSNDDISLNQVAGNVFISPSHFSALFSQKTGQPFVKYLTDLRMNKAKELLKCTDMRASDVGYMIGYRDPHYFSYLFKKTQNLTPKQYRLNSRLEGERK